MGVWSYAILGILVATEGPLSTLLGAAAAAAGMAELRWIVLATILGNIVGDCLWYSAGYLGKAETLKRYGGYVGIKSKHMDRLERGMHMHAIKLILFSKVAYGLIVPTLVAAGVARVPFRKWFPVVFVMETIWSLLLVYVGYHATWLLVDLERGLRTVGIVVVALALGGIAMWYVRSRRRGLATVTPVLNLADEQNAQPVGLTPVAENTRVQGGKGFGRNHGIAPRYVPSGPMALATRARTSVIHSVAPTPLMGESISVRFSEAFQVWESVGVSAPRLEAEPVEGGG